MSKQPPLLPVEMLRRVIRVARTNGTCVMVISSLAALAAAAGQDRLDTFIGLAVAGTAAMELHGTILIAGGEWRGFRWLVFSQFLLLAVMLGYAYYRMSHIDLAAISQLVPDSVWQQMPHPGQSLEEAKRSLGVGMYFLVALGTIAYQGGMILYYALRGRAVRTALPQE
ncbi:MAG TPA: hypothetical protein VGL42_09515 [Opitutaceae bacterium]|jgi:hypothetical protein